MEFSKNLKRYIASVVLVSSVVFSVQAQAGAFQLWEQSAASLGDYHAGAAAEANDASTVFYNPAGMTRIKHQQISFGAAFINLTTQYNGNVSINLPGQGVFPVGSTTTGIHGDTFNIVPNFHYVLPINDRWAFGIDETTPFGLQTKYDDFNSAVDNVNMLATKTELETVNLNPSLSFAVNKYISLGAGFDAMYGQAIYDNTNNVVMTSLTNKLNGWGYGYNAGVLVQFTPETRVGLSYRSQITIPATGTSTSSTTGLSPVSSAVSANFPLPATTMLSAYHDFTDRLALMASAFYTQWSCFHILTLQNLAVPNNLGTSNTSTLAINEDYRNTWNFALGGRYKFNQHIALEAGVGHDQTPTQLPYRDIRLPDSSHYVMSLGLNIHPKPDFEWSMGWTHLFINPTTVNNSGSYNAAQSTLPQGLFGIGQGTVDSGVNVFGIQLTWDV